MLNQDPSVIREVIYTAWDKHRAGDNLSPLETQIVGVIHMHPEFHDFFDKRQSPTEGNNPFYHLGLHLAIVDQISTDRPKGIRNVYQTLFKRLNNEHDVDHLIMGRLEEYLHTLHQQQSQPDDATYLTILEELIAP